MFYTLWRRHLTSILCPWCPCSFGQVLIEFGMNWVCILFCVVLCWYFCSWAGLDLHRVCVLLSSLFYWSFCPRSYVAQVRVWSQPKFIILAGNCAIEPSEREALKKKKPGNGFLKVMSPSSLFVISFKCKDKTMNIGWKGKVDQLVHSAESEVEPVKDQNICHPPHAPPLHTRFKFIGIPTIITNWQNNFFLGHMACTNLIYLRLWFMMWRKSSLQAALFLMLKSEQIKWRRQSTAFNFHLWKNTCELHLMLTIKGNFNASMYRTCRICCLGIFLGSLVKWGRRSAQLKVGWWLLGRIEGAGRGWGVGAEQPESCPRPRTRWTTSARWASCLPWMSRLNWRIWCDPLSWTEPLLTSWEILDLFFSLSPQPILCRTSWYITDLRK